MITSSTPPYPVTCPNCGKRDGIPTRASVGSMHGGVVVDLRCRACTAAWTEQLPNTQPL
jgi:hypothetical protein